MNQTGPDLTRVAREGLIARNKRIAELVNNSVTNNLIDTPTANWLLVTFATLCVVMVALAATFYCLWQQALTHAKQQLPSRTLVKTPGD